MSFFLKKGTTKVFMTIHKLVTCLQELAEKGDVQDAQPLLDLMNMVLPENIEKQVKHLTFKGEEGQWLCIMLRKKPEKTVQEKTNEDVRRINKELEEEKT